MYLSLRKLFLLTSKRGKTKSILVSRKSVDIKVSIINCRSRENREPITIVGLELWKQKRVPRSPSDTVYQLRSCPALSDCDDGTTAQRYTTVVKRVIVSQEVERPAITAVRNTSLDSANCASVTAVYMIHFCSASRVQKENDSENWSSITVLYNVNSAWTIRQRTKLTLRITVVCLLMSFKSVHGPEVLDAQVLCVRDAEQEKLYTGRAFPVDVWG